MGVEGKLTYTYFISNIRDPGWNRGDVGLEMLDVGSYWVIV